MDLSQKKETIDAYNKTASGYSQSHFAPFWVEEFERYKTLCTGKEVIDIGCGTGRDAPVFIGAGYRYTGVDASAEMLKIAALRAPAGVYRLMDFYHLEFPDETFDGFWAAASFLHVPKSEVSHVLVEAKRVIKPSGIGFISLKKKTDTDEGLIKQSRYNTTISRFFAFYDVDEFKKLLLDAGFEVLGCTEHHEGDESKTIWLCFYVRKP